MNGDLNVSAQMINMGFNNQNWAFRHIKPLNHVLGFAIKQGRFMYGYLLWRIGMMNLSFFFGGDPLCRHCQDLSRSVKICQDYDIL